MLFQRLFYLCLAYKRDSFPTECLCPGSACPLPEYPPHSVGIWFQLPDFFLSYHKSLPLIESTQQYFATALRDRCLHRCFPDGETEARRGTAVGLCHTPVRERPGHRASSARGQCPQKSWGQAARGCIQVKVRPPKTPGLAPSLLPHAWPCKLALTFLAPAFELLPIHGGNHKGRKRAGSREGPLPPGPRGHAPAGAGGLQCLFAQLGRLLRTPPPEEKHHEVICLLWD